MEYLIVIIAMIVLSVVAWVASKQPNPGPNPPPPPPPPPPPLPTPGSNVQWFNFPKQQDQNGGTPFLTDIVQHLPTYMGNQYYDSDKVTWGHETTHGINSHIRNTFAKGKQVGFYCGNNQACLVDQPNMTLTQIAGVIPQELRGSRYQLYFVQQVGDWNDTPLYCFDEWVAYTNGAQVGLEVSGDGVTDVMIGPIEFAIYAICTCLAIDKFDPGFLQSNVQYKEYVAHELKRAIGIYLKGIMMPQYKWDRALENTLKQNQACVAILNKMYGNALTMETLFDGTQNQKNDIHEGEQSLPYRGPTRWRTDRPTICSHVRDHS